MSELLHLDATAQAELVRTGETTPVELVEAAIDAIERLNPQLNAVIHERFDKARTEAAGTLPEGPFRGVPFVHKDLDGFTAGDPYHAGGRYLKEAGFVADHDSYLAAKLKGSGMVLVGKTNTPELGLQPTTEPQANGPTHNPWNPDHSPGGSSGGSAAAVASRMVAVGHAGDGGGSIRIPASECGLVGLKPTRGRVSLGPDDGDAWDGLVVRAVLTRSVRDIAGVLDVLAGPMPGDPHVAPPPARPYAQEVGADPGSLRVGLLTVVPTGVTSVHPDCVAAAEEAGRLLESLGHAVEAAYPKALEEELTGMFMPVFGTWTAHDLDTWARLGGRPVEEGDVEAGTWIVAESGRYATAAQYYDSKRQLQAWARRVAEWWNEFDLLLTPTLAEPPPRLGEFHSPDDPLVGLRRGGSLVPFTLPWNITGQPAVSLPVAWNADGLPIGVQLVAAFGREDVLIRVAAQVEQARPWADRRPPICA